MVIPVERENNEDTIKHSLSQHCNKKETYICKQYWQE